MKEAKIINVSQKPIDVTGKYSNDSIARANKMREAFSKLQEGVDYKKVPSGIDAPLQVFSIEPISEKGINFFKGKYDDIEY